MKDLIEALQIFLKYGNPDHPTACDHDQLYVMIDPAVVSYEDTKQLEKLGFYASPEDCNFYSFKFGSC